AVTIVATKRRKKHKRENPFCAFLRLFVAACCYAARGTRSGTLGFVATGTFTCFDNADLISRQWIEMSANTSASARHDQMIACTISTPRVSQPVTPITKRPAIKTSASAYL